MGAHDWGLTAEETVDLVMAINSVWDPLLGVHECCAVTDPADTARNFKWLQDSFRADFFWPELRASLGHG